MHFVNIYHICTYPGVKLILCCVSLLCVMHINLQNIATFSTCAKPSASHLVVFKAPVCVKKMVLRVLIIQCFLHCSLLFDLVRADKAHY